MRIRSLSCVGTLAILAFLAGCGPKSAEEIGSVHVAVLSRTPWEEYKSDIQPRFDITEAQALGDAIADTAQLEQAMLDSFRASLAIKVAPSASLPGGFATGSSGEGLTTTVSPAATQPSIAPPISILDKSALKNNRFLQYQAATALYQEVKLLNRYIQDAAIYKDYRPYIVRFQVSLMPRTRNQSYDTYLNLAFFLDPVTQPVSTSAAADLSRFRFRLLTESDIATMSPRPNLVEVNKAKENLIKKTISLTSPSKNDQALDVRVKILQLNDQKEAVAALPSLDNKEKELLTSALDRRIQEWERYKRQLDLTRKSPIVIPLLVTDEVESALAANRTQHLQQLSLALAAAYAGLGAQGSIDSIQQAVRNALGREYNSLFNVGRVNDNTIRVRIGARQSPSVKNTGNSKDAAEAELSYEMIPQSHFVTVLVLVPKEEVDRIDADLYFGSQMSFVNTSTGKAIKSGSRGQDVTKNTLYKMFAATYEQELINARTPEAQAKIDKKKTDEKAIDAQTLYKAATFAQNSNYPEFLLALNAKNNQEIGGLNKLWLDLTSARVGSTFDSGKFSLPPYVAPKITKTDQTCVSLIDDGKQTTGTIVGYGLDPLNLSARWTFETKDSQTLTFHASKITVSGAQAALTFPSLKAANLSLKSMVSALPATPPASSVTIAIAGQPDTTIGFTYATTESQAPSAGTLTVSKGKLGPSQTRTDEVDIVIGFSDAFSAFRAANPTNPASLGLLVDGATVDKVELQVPGTNSSNLATVEPVFESSSNPGSWIIPKPGRYRIFLKSLVPGSDVKFSVTSPASFKAPEPVVKQVDALPKS